MRRRIRIDFHLLKNVFSVPSNVISTYLLILYGSTELQMVKRSFKCADSASRTFSKLAKSNEIVLAMSSCRCSYPAAIFWSDALLGESNEPVRSSLDVKTTCLYLLSLRELATGIRILNRWKYPISLIDNHIRVASVLNC